MVTTLSLSLQVVYYQILDLGFPFSGLSLKGFYYQILDLKEPPELHLVNSFVLGKRSRLRTGEPPCPNGEPIRHSVLRVEYGLSGQGFGQLRTSEYREYCNTPYRTNTYSKARLLGFSNRA